jgi:4-hydroxy-tetrahydrodipicolinate synthase
MKVLIGAGVALITPFNQNKSIDFKALEQLIEFQISGGSSYLVILGTTGETATLSHTEKKEIFRFAAEKAQGRIPLVAGIGGNNTQEVIEQIRQIDRDAYSAVLSVSPYYNKPTQEGIFRHYEALAEASPLPIILYNVPGRTGSNIDAATTIRLAKSCSNIVGIKEASGNFSQYSEIMRDKPKDFILISGDDATFLPMAALGAQGLISVLGNAMPEEISHLVKAGLENDFVTGRQLHADLLDIIDLCFAEGNPGGIKSILQQKGLCENFVRLPLVEVSQPTQTLIAAELQRIAASKVS